MKSTALKNDPASHRAQPKHKKTKKHFEEILFCPWVENLVSQKGCYVTIERDT